MSLVQEFKEFAVKGNMIDMAVGIMIGAAFNKVVNSLVNDMIMPVLGKIIGGVNFNSLYINLSDTAFNTMDDAIKAGAPIIKYGVFIQSLVDFFIISFTIFFVLKFMTKLKESSVQKFV